MLVSSQVWDWSVLSGRSNVSNGTFAATQALRIILFFNGHFRHVTKESITVSSMSLCIVKCKRSEDNTSSADVFFLPFSKRKKQTSKSSPFTGLKPKSLCKLKTTGQL